MFSNAAMAAAQVPGLSVVRFILSDDERNPQVEREVLRFSPSTWPLRI
jgi:hypothetical protein